MLSVVHATQAPAMMGLDLNLLLLYIVTVTVMIALPGPVMILVVSAGLSGGPRRAWSTIAGTNAASLLLIALSALMVQGLLAINEAYFNGVKLVGALYIGYLGWDLLRAVPFEGQPQADGSAGGFGKGFMVAIANPKDIIFFASFFPQFIGIMPQPVLSLTVLTLLWVALDFATLMLMFQLVRRLLRPALQRALLRCSGVLLIAVALVGGVFAARALWSAPA